jgi:hypothetical protein
MISIFHPDNYDPGTESKEMGREIDALNDEMVNAGVRLFVGGLHYPENALALYPSPNGEVILSEGLHQKTGDHMAGFWVLDLESIEEALGWGQKAAVACRAAVEVRQFHW